MSSLDFGVRLKELRKEKGFTMQRLSDLADISTAYIANIENGKRAGATPDVIIRIAKALETDAASLLKLAGYKQLAEMTTMDEVFEQSQDISWYLQQLIDNGLPKLNGKMIPDDDVKRILDMIKLMYWNYFE